MTSKSIFGDVKISPFPFIIFIVAIIIFVLSLYSQYRYNTYVSQNEEPPIEYKIGNYLFYVMTIIIVVLFFGMCFTNPSICHLTKST